MANCPINEQAGDGLVVGRCWHHLPDGKTCWEWSERPRQTNDGGKRSDD